jgi:hypothetical protein
MPCSALSILLETIPSWWPWRLDHRAARTFDDCQNLIKAFEDRGLPA